MESANHGSTSSINRESSHKMKEGEDDLSSNVSSSDLHHSRCNNSAQHTSQCKSHPSSLMEVDNISSHHNFQQCQPSKSRIKRTVDNHPITEIYHSCSPRRRQSLICPESNKVRNTKCSLELRTNHSIELTNAHSNSSRMTTLFFMLLLGIAIIHAIVQGFEKMHENKQKQFKTAGVKSDLFNDSGALTGQGSLTENEVTMEMHQSAIDRNSDTDTVPFSSANTNGGTNERNSNIKSTAYPIPIENVGTTTDTHLQPATVLSRASQLAKEISTLDASDVVECYVVTRMASITNLLMSFSSAANVNNDNGSTHAEGKSESNPGNLDATDAINQQPQSSTFTTSTFYNSSTSMSPILVRKSALAFRYRPRVASAMRSEDFSSHTDQVSQQKYFELTLEYGPQRTGTPKTSESIPLLYIDTKLIAETDTNDIDINTNENNGQYVFWDNEARIYHSTHISSEWTEAYYMAPITGVVLEKIVQHAVDYTIKHPRYQPFEVVSVPSRELIVRSSGSDDFVWNMFHDLADLFVDIDPILVPPRARVQFYVADPEPSGDEKSGLGLGESRGQDTSPTGDIIGGRGPNPNVKRVSSSLEKARASLFYERFYKCVTAIKTGDYSTFQSSTSVESTSSSILKSNEIYDEVIEQGNSTNSYKNHDSEGNDSSSSKNTTQGVSYVHDLDNVDDLANISNNDVDTLAEESADKVKKNQTNSIRNRFLLHRRFRLDQKERNIDALADLLLNRNLFIETIENSTMTGSYYNDSDTLMEKVGNITNDGNSVESTDDGIIDEDNGDAAILAEKAAIAAAYAAENAAVVASSNSSSAADSAAAASEAAEAAKKAANATVTAKNKVASEGLISGDGGLITSILSNCFADTKYGIRLKEENNSPNPDNEKHSKNDDIPDGNDIKTFIEVHESIYVYIYLDGNTFFRLNLTAPYWGTTLALQKIPTPQLKPEGKGDIIDWAIFIIILMGTLFGLVVMIHQGILVIDKRLQFRWFFKPTHHEIILSEDEQYEDLIDNSSLVLKQGAGYPHSFGIDVIPMSMGGMQPRCNESHLKTIKCDSIPHAIGEDEKEFDFEMTPQYQGGSEMYKSYPTVKNGSIKQFVSLSNSRFIGGNPDFVERPSLITTSKVALPHQSPKRDNLTTLSTYEDVNHSDHPMLPLA